MCKSAIWYSLGGFFFVWGGGVVLDNNLAWVLVVIYAVPKKKYIFSGKTREIQFSMLNFVIDLVEISLFLKQIC